MQQHRSIKLDFDREETILNADGTITIYLPIEYKKVGGRSFIMSPTEPIQQFETIKESEPLVNAVLKAFEWREKIELGKVSSMAEIGKKEGVSDSYIGRLFRLTLLAPDIVEAILDGKQPKTFTLSECMKPFPLEWEAQRIKFGFKVASI
jgi:hypothetical protein